MAGWFNLRWPAADWDCSITTLIAVVRLINLLSGGIYAGFLVAVFVLELTLRAFDASVYTQVEQVKHRWLNVLAVATLTPALASGFLLLLLPPVHSTAFILSLVALLSLVGALVITLRVNVPINAAQMTWNVQTPPLNWAAIRDRWQAAHILRSALAVAAFCCQIVATLVAP
jgi:hypothetical protein